MKNKLPIISFVAAILTMLIGILVLIGWFTHNRNFGTELYKVQL